MRWFKEKLEKVMSHPFTADVAVLQLASVFARAIGLVTAFLFARILGPEQYGFYTLVFALAGTINIFQEFGVGQGSINMLARAKGLEEEQEAHRILKFFTLVSVFGLLVPGLIGFLIAPYLGERFYNDRYLGILAAIPVAMTALTFFFPLSAISLQVARKIKTLAVLETANKILNSLIPLVLVLAGFGVAGIVGGQFATMVLISVASFIVYARLSRLESFFPEIPRLLSEYLSWRKIKSYLRFCLEIAFSKNLIKLNSTIPLLFAGHFLPTTSSLGYYKIALAYMALPLVLLDPVTRLLNVQFPETEKSGTPRLMRRFLQVSMVSGAIMAAGIIPMILIAPRIINLLFPDYSPSIPLIYSLAVYPLLVSLGVGLGPLFRTLNKMRAAIFIQLITFFLLLPLAYFLINNYALVGLVLTTLIFTLIPDLLSFIYFFFIFPKNANRENLQQI